ncbi:ABC transporter substrate-binding protein [Bordetella genomosp. 9]|uniref:ABC transporter substrate-binding protein n=1 Tax=Bordetella genomosp. 9 TaxID=1416803 RepID=A0A261RPZ8_9BORD|nr:tripartite tricarboxylate transporter substrate binding protein [Bordetella genomosp. 9]OZI26752.1 ABC transporter substrate-binding protein [Bordetella genomosp. 9]
MRALITASIMALAAIGTASAQSPDGGYPSKPIHLVVPYPAGGMPDRVARDVAQELQGRLNQPVIVENRSGASGNIGFDYAMRQPADGYTLVLSPASNLATQKALFKSLSYDPQRDFEVVSVLVEAPQILLVNPKVEAESVGQLIAFARAHPGKLSFGTTLGAFSHLAGELMRTQEGISFATIPYQGSNVAVRDLLGGQVDMMFYDSVGSIPLIRGGKVRALGVASSTRLVALPDVPTLDEAGIKGFEAISWYALVTRTGTPDSVVDTLGKELREILASPAFRKRYEEMGASTVSWTTKEAAAFVASETAKWTAVIKTAGVQAN